MTSFYTDSALSLECKRGEIASGPRHIFAPLSKYFKQSSFMELSLTFTRQVAACNLMWSFRSNVVASINDSGAADEDKTSFSLLPLNRPG